MKKGSPSHFVCTITEHIAHVTIHLRLSLPSVSVLRYSLMDDNVRKVIQHPLFLALIVSLLFSVCAQVNLPAPGRQLWRENSLPPCEPCSNQPAEMGGQLKTGEKVFTRRHCTLVLHSCTCEAGNLYMGYWTFSFLVQKVRHGSIWSMTFRFSLNQPWQCGGKEQQCMLPRERSSAAELPKG